MANIAVNPSFFPRRLSQYVPACSYASEVNMAGDSRISFGAVALKVAAFFLNATAITNAGSTTAILNDGTIPGPFGRNLEIVLSGVGVSTVNIDGFDYLGQPMRETMTSNGATIVVGLKSFKYVTQVTWTAVATMTMNVGTGARLGMPYKAIKVLSEEAAGAPVTNGTLTNAVLTDPQTAITGDPRGQYTSTTTHDGVTEITAGLMFANDVNANNRGGLFGIQHFGV